MTGEPPTTVIGLLALIIVTLGGIVHLRIQQQITSRQVRDSAGKIDEMHEQTVNDHQQQSNLREDLDTTRDATIASHDVVSEIREIARDMQERQMAQGREIFGLRTDITGVRTDVSGLRTDVSAVNERLHDERERSIRTDESLWRAIQNRPPAAE
ncbi:MAG: hypothetical protein M3Y83_04690 [Actinomycetota bacterium]|nr:hypothetical protein [Actinomycetota bacterium]